MNVEYIQHCGSDLAVVNAARVSFDKESEWEEEPVTWGKNDTWITEGEYKLPEKDEKLIHYLAKHEHFSPFNHTFITVRVKAPIFVARQLVKHEYMPWNEVSRRYVDSPPEFFYPESLSERPSDGIKQGSGGVHPESAKGLQEGSEAVSVAIRLYNDMIDRGFAPEQARMFLPQNMYTEWYWSGTLKAFAKMYNLRIDAHAQKETQFIAQECDKIIRPLFPVAWSALVDEV